MEETQWVVMIDFLHSDHQLKKKEEQLKLVKERVSFLEMRQKSLEAEVVPLSEKAQEKELEWKKLQEELKKSQSINPILINELQMRNWEYPSQLALAEENLQQKDGKLASQCAQHEEKLENNKMDFKGQKSQLENKLQEMNSSLDIELEKHALGEENWFKELSNIGE